MNQFHTITINNNKLTTGAASFTNYPATLSNNFTVKLYSGFAT